MASRRKTYEDYINSEEWRNLRSLKIQESGRDCKCCGNSEPPIVHVHHIRYKELHDCTTEDLVVLCSECHDDFHMACKRRKIKYIGLESNDIKAVVASFRENPEFRARSEKRKAKLQKRRETRKATKEQRRLAKKKRREERRAIQALKPKPVRRVKKQIRRSISGFLNGDPTTEYLERAFSEIRRLVSPFLGKPWPVTEPQVLKSVYVDEPTFDVITMDVINSIKTDRGGFTARGLRRIGVAWPPKNGWRSYVKEKGSVAFEEMNQLFGQVT